jgi:anti-sigma B factor antagonist
MKIVTRKENSAVAILDLEGPLTVTADTRCVTETLEELLQLGVERIVLNLEGVSYLDCAGIGRLLEFREQIVSSGGCLKLAQLDSKFQTLLDLFHLTPVLGGCESEKAIVASFFEQTHLLVFEPRKQVSSTVHSKSDSTTSVANRYTGAISKSSLAGDTWS